MDTYTYQLTEQEYFEYAKSIVVRDRKMRFYRLNFSILLPVILAILILGFGLRNGWVYLAALLLSFIWLLFANWLFQRAVRNKTQQLLNENGALKMSEIRLRISDQGIWVNDSRLTLQQYLLMNEMIKLTFTNGSEVLVPSRLFENDQNKLKAFLKHLAKLHASSRKANG